MPQNSPFNIAMCNWLLSCLHLTIRLVEPRVRSAWNSILSKLSLHLTWYMTYSLEIFPTPSQTQHFLPHKAMVQIYKGIQIVFITGPLHRPLLPFSATYNIYPLAVYVFTGVMMLSVMMMHKTVARLLLLEFFMIANQVALDLLLVSWNLP